MGSIYTYTQYTHPHYYKKEDTGKYYTAKVEFSVLKTSTEACKRASKYQFIY